MSSCLCISCSESEDLKHVNRFMTALVMVLVLSTLMIIVSTCVLVTASNVKQEGIEEVVTSAQALRGVNYVPDTRRDIPSSEEIEEESDMKNNCTLVYTAVQPNFVGQKTPVATLTRNICKQRRPQQSSRRRTSSSRSKSSSRHKLTRKERRKRRRLLRKARRRRQKSANFALQKSASLPRGPRKLRIKQQTESAEEVERQKQLWLEGEEYRNWKRRKSVVTLLKQPQSQLAVEQLWQRLIRSGDHWGQIYQEMHNRTFPFPLDDEITKEDITEFNHKNEDLHKDDIIPHLKHEQYLESSK